MLKKHNIEQDLHWEKSKNYAIFIIVGKQERYTIRDKNIQVNEML